MNSDLALTQAETGLRRFMQRVYGWMALGLAVTGACAAYMASDPQMIVNLVRMKPLFYGLLIAEFGLVAFLSFAVQRMEASTAKFAFLFYAALTGVTLSVVYLRFTGESIGTTFFLTAGLFGAMSVYGWLTKSDLTTLGSLCLMGLIGILLASLVNFFLRSDRVSWITSCVGVLVFTGLTAYDAQKIKAVYRPGEDGTELETKEAILGALSLYLDFINLFLELLNLMGRRRD